MVGPNRKTVLVVDDERGVRQSFHMLLKDHYEVLLAADGSQALAVIDRQKVGLVLLDILLPDVDGLDLLGRFVQLDPDMQVIMVTAVNDVQTAVRAIKAGAYDYVIKPFVVEDVLKLVGRALEQRELRKQVAFLKRELAHFQPFEDMVGRSAGMRALFEMIAVVADADGPVLIQGESGTGKELAARAIHNRSPRRDEPFVVVNCAAIPGTLMESSLFGHVRGAFTGATRNQMGKLEAADGGTVFFDDIDSLDVPLQAKLLRSIQERELETLGSHRVVRVDVRFVAASNRDLIDLVASEDFRQDLYYRLNVFPLTLPPLRDRPEDIPLLAEHFLRRLAEHSRRTSKAISPRAMERLVAHDWPGNVRELKNLMERLQTIVPDEVIGPRHLPLLTTGDWREIRDLPLKEAVGTFERQYISAALKRVNGNRKQAAAELGIHRNTLLTKMGSAKLDS